MKIEEVGLEALPNCYVKAIEISDHSEITDMYTIEFVLKDVLKNDGKYIWYNSDILYKNLKILSVLSYDEELNEKIDNGDITFTKKEIFKHTNSAIVKMSSIMRQRPTISEDKEIEEGVLYSFCYTENYKVQKKYTNVKLYVALIIDLEEVLNSKKITLPQKRLSSLRGPIFSETIKENNVLKNTTSLFIKQDNTVYIGAVHEHEGGFMEGSYHKQEPHERLTEQKIYNFKLRNYKKEMIQQPVTQAANKRTPVFSPIYFSYSGDLKQSSMFSLNIRSAVLRDSKIGQRLFAINPRIFSDLMYDIKLLNLSVEKQRVQTTNRISKSGTQQVVAKSKQQYVKLISSRDSTPQTFIPMTKPNVEIQEMITTTDPMIRSFVVNETFYKETKQKSIYKISMTLNDPFTKYFEDLNKVYKKTLKDYKIYANRATIKSIKQKGYSLSKRFIDEEISKSISNPDASPWTNMSRDYASLVSHLKNTNEEEVRLLMEEAVFLSYPLHANTTSINSLLQKFSILYDRFVKTYKINQGTKRDSSNRGHPKNTLNPTITATRTMRAISTFEGRTKCLHYLPFKSNGFPTISLSLLNEQAQKEISNNFVNEPSFSGTKLSRKDKAVVEVFSDYQDTLISYLNPMMIQDGKNTLQTDGYASIDHEKLNDLLDNFEEPVRPDSVSRRRSRKSLLSVKSAKTRDSYIKLNEKKTKSADQNLGKTNKFKKSGTLFEETNSTKINKRTSNFLKRQKPKLKKINFDVSNTKTLGDLHKRTMRHNMLPIALKSVFVSDSSNVRNSFMSEDNKSIDNPKTFNSFRLSYLSPIKIEYLSGYATDSLGNTYFTKPQWKLLTEKDSLGLQFPTLCRMRYHEVDGFTNSFESLHIANDHFILMPNDEQIVKQKPQSSQPSSQSARNVISRISRIKPEQCASNVVKHPENLRLLKQPMEPMISTSTPVATTSTAQRTAAPAAPTTATRRSY